MVKIIPYSMSVEGLPHRYIHSVAVWMILLRSLITLANGADNETKTYKF